MSGILGVVIAVAILAGFGWRKCAADLQNVVPLSEREYLLRNFMLAAMAVTVAAIGFSMFAIWWVFGFEVLGLVIATFYAAFCFWLMLFVRGVQEEYKSHKKGFYFFLAFLGCMAIFTVVMVLSL